MKNVLMICYYYPPLVDVGCKRSVAFSKYFQKHGITPWVLSVKNPDKFYCSFGNDLVPEGVHVTRSYSLMNLYRILGKLNGVIYRFLSVFGVKLKKNIFYELCCIPDPFMFWIPLTVIKGLRVIQRENIDVVYVSCSPFSSAIVGWWLKKLCKKPLVIDFRDPFGLDISAYQKKQKQNNYRKGIDKKIMSAVISKCDKFVVTTKETKQLYLQQYSCAQDKIEVVYNGFDNVFMNTDQVEKFKKFTMIYAGNFYYEVEYDYFFKGLGKLKQRGVISQKSFQFIFYGGEKSRVEKEIRKYKIEDLVKIRNRIPYTEIVLEIKKSHLQLLRIMKPMISTKLFDGLALNIPFFATIPQGEVAEIISKYSPSSKIVNMDAFDVCQKLIQSISDYKAKNIKNNDVSAFLSIMSREKQAGDMAQIIGKAITVSIH